MATWTVFNLAKLKLGQKKFDLGSDTYKMALTTSTQSIAATFIGSSTDCRYADLTNEVANGNGYTTGGVTLTSTSWTQSTGTMTLDFADASWTSSTFSCRYAIIYDSTPANKDLLAFADFGSDLSPSSGTLSIPVTNVFTLA